MMVVAVQFGYHGARLCYLKVLTQDGAGEESLAPNSSAILPLHQEHMLRDKRVTTLLHAITQASKVVATVLSPQLASTAGNRIPQQNSPRRVRLADKAAAGSKGPGRTKRIGRVVNGIVIMATGPRTTLYQRRLGLPARLVGAEGSIPNEQQRGGGPFASPP